MKQSILLLLLFTISCSPKTIVRNDNNSKPFDKEKLVREFIEIIEKNDVKKLSERTLFPLNRIHPLTEVVDKQDFLKRYDEIFDLELRNMIVQSDPKKDWENVGSKGIMLKNGKLWIDFSGSLIAVNYQSKVEKEKAAATMKNQNLDLHESVRVFEKPVLELETKTYLIRIDNLGSYKYRYTGWANNGKLKTSKPDIILYDGEMNYEGSGGDYRFEFKNDGYRYVVRTIKMGPNDAPPALLKIYQGTKEIFSEGATVFKD